MLFSHAAGEATTAGAHRKPRRSKARLLGAGAVVGALTLTPLVTTAAPAQADGTIWDKLAWCESGQRWHLNLGTGYSGGLQFKNSSWLDVGGGKYARYPYQASKAEQIAVAKHTLALVGPGAWPVCSVKTGLTRSNGLNASSGSVSTQSTPKKSTTTAKKAAAKKAAAKAAAHRAAAHRAAERAAAHRAAERAAAHRAAERAAAHRAAADRAAAHRAAAERAAAHRAAADRAAADRAAAERAAAHRAAERAAAHRAAEQAAVKKHVVKHASPAKANGTLDYTVKLGDTLSGIADRLNVNGGWKAIWNKNHSRIQNPNLIYVGERLDVR